MAKVAALSLATMSMADNCATEYQEFVQIHNKEYSQERLEIFCESLDMVNTHNAQNSGFTLEINKFADWTLEERRQLTGAIEVQPPNHITDPTVDKELSDAVDYRPKMPPAKNQGDCGSCWAFSAIAVVDFFGGNHSEQQLVDCDTGGDDAGCEGGNPYTGLKFLSDGKIPCARETDYDYTGKDGTCQGPPSLGAMISNPQYGGTASWIMQFLQNQVVAVMIQTGKKEFGPLSQYASGIYDQDCGHDEDGGHAMAAVGYTQDYWIIRNSWGTDWGLEGHAYWKKGINLCNIESFGAVADVQTDPKPTPDPTPAPTPAPTPVPTQHCQGSIPAVKFDCPEGTACCGAGTLAPSCCPTSMKCHEGLNKVHVCLPFATKNFLV